MSKRANLYLGSAGQHVVVSEFLVRGWNVAIPEVDVGDDIFVVRDSDGKLHRIQVKTATAQARNYGYSARFQVPLSQLSQAVEPDLTYVVVVRYQNDGIPFCSSAAKIYLMSTETTTLAPKQVKRWC